MASEERKFIIGAVAILTFIGIVSMTFGVSALNAKMTEISTSTRTNASQDAYILMQDLRLNRIEAAMQAIHLNSKALSRIEGRLESWEPIKK